MILVIDIGNTTIAFTGIGTEDRIIFEDKLPTSMYRETDLFFKEAEKLLAIRGIVPLYEKDPETRQPVGNQGEISDLKAEMPDSEVEMTALEAEITALEAEEPVPVVEMIAICSVVPACTPEAVRLAERFGAVPPHIVTCHSHTGLSFDFIPVPEKIGADRIADAAWAAANCPLPAMTVDLGTATTINIIDREGEFLGGMIGAGVKTMLRALGAGTAQLPDLSEGAAVPVGPDDLIGRDTMGCMLSAAVVGTAAMIDGLALRVEDQLGLSSHSHPSQKRSDREEDCPIDDPESGQRGEITLVLTGGNAAAVAPWIRHSFLYEPNLAARGAAMIAQKVTNSITG